MCAYPHPCVRAQPALDSVVRKLLLKMHPDKDKRAMGTEESTRRAQTVTEARGILREAILAKAL